MKLVFAIVVVATVVGCAHRQEIKRLPVQVERQDAPAITPPPTVAAPALMQTIQAPAGPPGMVTIHFDFDRYEIRDDQRPALERAAVSLLGGGGAVVAIEGHTDERGTVEYNLALGQRRADAVRRALEALGVGGDAIRAVSYGEEQPVDPGHDEAAWARNRRCEIRQ